ncbi:dethiobiotin synthase [Fibrella forsythiae]|uniref:ATP-dependent dethiobiotin synthetase BioD n=1 Tax=Fibrella forsythiae TaxID=2817061 RepID=A0ABS3JHH5_9BACT|nr:dethiobiotin synthase [Fibrella forsythiae]MBO0949452.1 dethiobiotin synthase [Fibrella forsythiae]
MHLLVAGIGTEVGKTVASAVLVEALQADYWKPIQSGYPPDSDTATVRSLISNSRSRFHPETYLLREPLSPHAAAAAEGVSINPARLIPPTTGNSLVAELAGGLMVPLTDTYLNIDFIVRLGWPVVLVTRNYLGSINHTLLSVEALRHRNIPIVGLIINGPRVAATESILLSYTGLPCLVRINDEPSLTPEVILGYAKQVRMP